SLPVSLSYAVTTTWGRYVRHAANCSFCVRYEPATASRASTSSQSHQRRLLRGLATVSAGARGNSASWYCTGRCSSEFIFFKPPDISHIWESFNMRTMEPQVGNGCPSHSYRAAGGCNEIYYLGLYPWKVPHGKRNSCPALIVGCHRRRA